MKGLRTVVTFLNFLNAFLVSIVGFVLKITLAIT